MTAKPSCAIFCDFDGTISCRDVGYNLFRHFSGGANTQFIPAWKSGVMSSREILTAEAALVTGTPDEMLSFVMEFKIDPTFSDFVRACELEQIPLQILSDGLETYITPILKREKLEHLPVTANRGVFTKTGIAVEFPHSNISCTRCGSCKAERIREFKAKHGDNATVVFVGDGMSDLCATKEADLLFAKKDLEVYCQRNDIAYLPFTDFSEVLKALQMRGLVGNKETITE